MSIALYSRLMGAFGKFKQNPQTTKCVGHQVSVNENMILHAVFAGSRCKILDSTPDSVITVLINFHFLVLKSLHVHTQFG